VDVSARLLSSASCSPAVVEIARNPRILLEQSSSLIQGKLRFPRIPRKHQSLSH
jgi:hypothetical protein